MEIFLCSIYILLFFFLIKRSSFIQSTRIKPNLLYLFFLIKIVAGILITLYYSQHYARGDMFAYFEDAKIIHGTLKENLGTYFKLLTGFDRNNPELGSFYLQMKNSDFYFIEDNFIVNSFMIRLNALMMLFSFGYFNVHIVIMCALSFIGLIGLYKTFSTNLSDFRKDLLQIIIFLTPSVLAWSSVVLKEGIVIFSLGVLTYCIYKQSISPISLRFIITGILSFLILFFAKKYIALATIIPLLSFFVINKFSLKKPSLIFTSICLLCFFGAWFIAKSITHISPSIILIEQQQKSVRQAEGGLYLYDNKYVRVIPFGREDMVTQITVDSLYKINKGSKYKSFAIGDFQHESIIENSPYDTTVYHHYAHITPANHIITLPLVNENVFSIFEATPYALFNSIFYPFILQTNNTAITLVAIENVIILILLLICFLFTTIKNENNSLILLSASISVTLLILFGLTTPVLGTLVRYKSIAFPFLLTTGILILDENKLFNKFKSKALK